jgi:hypothetical protein
MLGESEEHFEVGEQLTTVIRENLKALADGA